MLGALSTGHTVGLAVMAAVFIGFALAASFLAPRRWPDFPGRNGLSVFIIACLALFVAMLAAVSVFGAESEANGASAHEGAAAGRTVDVSETEFKITLPKLSTLTAGEYHFVVKNDGQIAHDLVIQGPKVPAGARTPTIQPGLTADLAVSLAAGRYTLYCSIDGHRKLGMVAQLSVG